jgi:beta-lactam-binding protein with PASTA domain
MRRSLVVPGVTVVVLILGFVALFAAGGSGTAPESGAVPTLPRTATAPERATTTTIVTLNGPATQEPVEVVPNVVGGTLGYAVATLAKLGLSPETSNPAGRPGGPSVTGTVLAQAPTPGSKVPQGQAIQLTVSGY